MTGPIRTLVIGGSGQIGARVTGRLLAMGHAVSVLTRGAAVAPGARALTGALSDRSAVRAALETGIDRVVLITPDMRDQGEVETAIIAELAAAKVGFVAKLSAQSAGLSPPVSFGRHHAVAERALVVSGLPHAVLRPTFYQDSLLLFAGDIRRGKPMMLPVKSGRVAMVAASDVAEALALLAHRAEPRSPVTLTGPAALSFPDIAGMIGAATGQRVGFRTVPALLARLVLPLAAGLPFWKAQLVVDLFRAIERGAQEPVSRDGPALLGRPPATLSDFLAARHADFAPDAS
ncbi:NAD(P)H-binding protein [Chachezhania antarctica]|uniref:NmrA family NAD(P)-binding protein n=1 Tax=Chachezhania antarctica TaxID=2340860 RepID=UPI0013CE4683|nr:NAD(P)H-binding protein [Chachezhania antarctica]